LITGVNVHPLPQVVPIPTFGGFVGDDRVFRPNEPMAAGAVVMLDELHKWASALKTMRTIHAA
jgi:hypothetical protein